MKISSIGAGLAIAASALTASAADIQIAAADIVAGQTYNWVATNVYHLNGFVFVPAGARLNIAPGTVIKAKEGTAALASALIVSRGGRIYAQGTAQNPIIFTAEIDDLSSLTDITLDYTSASLWGGVIICGRAPNNNPGQVMQAEGVPPEFGDKINYGDSVNNTDPVTGVVANPTAYNQNVYDTSGVIQYVSIRHAGSVLAANKEINGLTFCSVGKGTVVDHVEVFFGGDDGYEWFGGTVDCKYLVSAFSEDDSYDYDQAYSGRAQFMFAIQSPDSNHGNRLGEFDSDDPTSAGFKPYAKPVWYNLTLIGSGAASHNVLNDWGLIYKENAGGTMGNSIITDFKGAGVRIEDKATGADARQRLEAGDIVIKNNIFYGFGKSSGIADSAWEQDSLAARGNLTSNPLLRGISRTNNGQLIPQPGSGSPALNPANAATPPNDGFFTATNYIGAFGDGTSANWMAGWTFLSQAGYLGTFTTGIEKQSVSAAALYVSAQPNPFQGKVQVSFIMPRNEKSASVSIYDMQGKLVRNLLAGNRLSGRQQIAWNGAKTDGTAAASGVYILQVKTGKTLMQQKLVLIR